MVQNLGLIPFSLLLLFTFFLPISADTEVRALMEIKSSLDPENKVLQSWQINGDPCTFEGVACNERRKVANISLQGRGLVGKLSPAIGDLKFLSGIYLHYNSISGKIPAKIANLSELVDLYLNVNNFSGVIPSEIGHMPNLQVLDLCCNHLIGNIPTELGSLSKLIVLSLQYNQLNGTIPPSLGNLGMLKRLDLSYNHLSGPIPITIAHIQPLHFLDIRNNSLSGGVPTSLKRLDTQFMYRNNTNLCGEEFHPLRACTPFDNANADINHPPHPSGLFIFKNHSTSRTNPPPPATNLQSSHSNSSRFPHSIIFFVVVVGMITAGFTLMAGFILTFLRHRRKKQMIGSKEEDDDALESRLRSTNHTTIDMQTRNGFVERFKFNLEEVEYGTQYFSVANVLGKGNFSTVYKGILRDGSVVAIKSIRLSSCKAEEAEVMKGIELLVSLRHENLVRVRGFCCPRGRGECLLVYEFASNGNLFKYLDVACGSSSVLDWSTRVNIINGIAKGVHYLHQESATKPRVVHQNICAEKILIDQWFNPMISDAGIPQILADDSIFSTLKMSAAMGYLAPEYITTGRFTEKSDVYAFGVTVLHILSGQKKITNAMRSAAESSKLEEFIDQNLNGKYSMSEASVMVKIGLSCTEEFPEQRPDMGAVVQEINRICGGSSPNTM